MLFKPTVTLLLATVAAAAPSKREKQPNVSMWLTHSLLAVSEEAHGFTDGTAVVINPTITNGTVSFSSRHYVDHVLLDCVGECPPEYHCKLYDSNLAPYATVVPRGTKIKKDKPSKVGLIICGEGKPSDA